MTITLKPYVSSSALAQDGIDSLKFNLGGAERKLESITCTQSSGALTFTLNPTIMAIRSPVLTSGVPSTVQVDTAITLVLPSGGTLGFPTTILGRIVQVLMSNGELAVISLSGGVSLSEEGSINTTAISAGSTANNIFYSTTARTGQTYRVVGAVDVVNTAGAWGSPSLVQPMGGNALTAMSSLGYGQTWQNVSASRAMSTTYTNSTGKPIAVHVVLNSTATHAADLVVNGSITLQGSTWVGAGGQTFISAIIPNGATYLAKASSGASAQISWHELR